MKQIEWDSSNWKEKENGDFLFDLANITAKTFDITAEKWAKVIANSDRGVEKNQLRNFYDKVLELEEKAINIKEGEFETKILPFIKMLNSKVAYAKNRQQSSVNQAFVEFINEAMRQIVNPKTFANFKFLFEAVVGFYQKGDFIKKEERYNSRNSYKRYQGGRR